MSVHNFLFSNHSFFSLCMTMTTTLPLTQKRRITFQNGDCDDEEDRGGDPPLSLSQVRRRAFEKKSPYDQTPFPFPFPEKEESF